ncbi:SCO6880 family protein, partial [Motilibacter deserti]
MSASTVNGNEGPRTYGNFVVPRSPGVFGLGTLGSGLLLVGLVMTVLVQLGRGFIAAGVTLLLFIALLAPIKYRNRAGRNGWQTLTTRVAWARGKRKGHNTYLSALVSPIAFGSARLPGLLARSEVFEAQTSYGERFAMVSIPAARHYAVVLSVAPEGGQLVDAGTVDSWVAEYGRFLSDLAHEPGLEAVTTTIETAPDPGTRLASEVRRTVRTGAPGLAQEMMEEAASTFPAGAATVRGWVTLTFSARKPATVEEEGLTGRGKKATSKKSRESTKALATGELAAYERGEDPTDAGLDEDLMPSALPRPANPPQNVRSTVEMAVQIGQRLPGLMEHLAATGAGTVRAMRPHELAEVVRVAYDPAAAVAVEEAHAAGEDTGITWDSAGPAAAVASWGAYRHDSGTSVTYATTRPPIGAVQSSVLERLLAPHPGVDRKRVTVVYRPYAA